MVVYDIYYMMVATATANVSGVWRVLHVTAQFMAAATGIMCTWYFSTILHGFNKRCPLFAIMEFSLIRPNSIGHNFLPKNVSINMRESNWGPDLKCQYCLSIWMISFIAGIALGTFFLYNQKGGRGEDHDKFIQPWRHLYPALIVSLIMMIQAIFAAYYSAHGFSVFCLEFQPYVDDAHCNQLIDKFTLPIRNKVLPIYTAMIIVKACAPLCILAWLCLTVSLILRIILTPDFRVQMIKIVGVRKIGGASLIHSLMGSLSKQIPLNSMPEFSLMNLEREKSAKPISKQSKKADKSHSDLLSHMSDLSDIFLKAKRRPSSKRRKSIEVDRTPSDASFRSDLEVPIHRKSKSKSKKGKSLSDLDEASPSTSTKTSIVPVEPKTVPPVEPDKQSWLSRWWQGKPAEPKDVEAQSGSKAGSSQENTIGASSSDPTGRKIQRDPKKRPSISFKDKDVERSMSEDDQRRPRKDKKDENEKKDEEDKNE